MKMEKRRKEGSQKNKSKNEEMMDRCRSGRMKKEKKKREESETKTGKADWIAGKCPGFMSLATTNR